MKSGKGQQETQKVTSTSDSSFRTLSSPLPSTSQAKRHVFSPISNLPVQGKKNEVRELDNTGTPKKKNRRRERKDKYKSVDQAPSSPPNLAQLKMNDDKDIQQHKKVQGFREPLFNPIITWNFQPVKNPQHFQFFKKRNKKHKYIGLKTFVPYISTAIFETDVNYLCKKYKQLNLKNRPHEATSVVQFNVHREILVTQSTPEGEQSVAIVEDENMMLQQYSEPKERKKPKKGTHKHRRTSEWSHKKESTEEFPPTYTPRMAKLGEERGELIRGAIRINPLRYTDAFVSNFDTAIQDFIITSVGDRNGALEGDEVLIKVKPKSEWQDGQMTAVVVFIVDKVHPRTAVGNIKVVKHENVFKFYPRDKRFPVMQIPQVTLPKDVDFRSKDLNNILFSARLVNWPQPNRAMGVIIESLGVAGSLKVETIAILKEFALDTSEFPPYMLENLPQWTEMPEEYVKNREDLRKQCIFTIDPLTAQDLDDAVSVRTLPNGHYQVGVHISDASFYLQEGTPLDKMVSSKATTIYLVDTAYHMLPKKLCLHCSLLPGQDKLSFSVFWEMDEKGNIFDTKFVRSVVNSCAQLSYEDAQKMIEDPMTQLTTEIKNGFTSKDLSDTVNVLQKIAVNLRNNRIRNGALRIDQVKLLFKLDSESQEPVDFRIPPHKHAHKLIEEFMLLTNITVAKKIQDCFPDTAFLRCHEPPKTAMLVQTKNNLETCGIHIDISSSGAIHESLNKYITDDYQGMLRGIVLNHLFAKPMTRARYFCAGTVDNEDGFWHYALSVPIYTHFTSPIRRYADIMVHRLLAASLGYSAKPNWDLEQVTSIALNCNKQKYNAKRAGEASSELYLAHYVEKNQPYEQDCVVVDVKDRSFDCIVVNTGSVVRVYQNKCEDNATWTLEKLPSVAAKSSNRRSVLLLIEFPVTETHKEPQRMVVDLFSVVRVRMKRIPNSYKLEAFLLRPQ